MLPRAIARVPARDADTRPIRDTLLLVHEQRKNPSGVMSALRGTAIEFALPRGTVLRHDDLLLLDDGGLVEIVARPEPLIEIRADDVTKLARAAWLLGDHHIPAELTERHLRVRRSEAVAILLKPLGLRLADIDAPFEPEGGAYDHG